MACHQHHSGLHVVCRLKLIITCTCFVHVCCLICHLTYYISTVQSQSPVPPHSPSGLGDCASLQHVTEQPSNSYDIPQDSDESNLFSSVRQPTQALVK